MTDTEPAVPGDEFPPSRPLEADPCMPLFNGAELRTREARRLGRHAHTFFLCEVRIESEVPRDEAKHESASGGEAGGGGGGGGPEPRKKAKILAPKRSQKKSKARGPRVRCASADIHKVGAWLISPNISRASALVTTALRTMNPGADVCVVKIEQVEVADIVLLHYGERVPIPLSSSKSKASTRRVEAFVDQKLVLHNADFMFIPNTKDGTGKKPFQVDFNIVSVVPSASTDEEVKGVVARVREALFRDDAEPVNWAHVEVVPPKRSYTCQAGLSCFLVDWGESSRIPSETYPLLKPDPSEASTVPFSGSEEGGASEATAEPEKEDEPAEPEEETEEDM